MSAEAAGGIILFILITLWTVIWVSIYSHKEWPHLTCTKVAAWFRPKQGCEGSNSSDYTTPMKLRLPLAFLLISLALKVTAVAYDRWDKGGVQWFFIFGRITVYMYLGVISTHTEVTSGDSSLLPLLPIEEQSSQMYSSLCGDDSIDSNSCHVMQMGGILVLASSLISLALHVSIFVHAIMFFRNPACMPQYVYRVWWQAAMMVLATMNACNYHGGVTHVAGQGVIGTGTGVGVSWYLMVAAFVIDVIIRYFYRFATNSTKEWDGAPAPAPVASSSPPAAAAVAAEDVNVEVRDPNSRMLHPSPAGGPNANVYPAASSASPPPAASSSNPGFFARLFGGGSSEAAPRSSVAAPAPPAHPASARSLNNDPFNIYNGEQNEVASSAAAQNQPRRSQAGAYGQSDGFFSSYQPPTARPQPMYEDDTL